MAQILIVDCLQSILDALENWEFKAESYADVAAYQTGLTTETAAGWQPNATAVRETGLGVNEIVVTYRRLL